MWHRQHLQQTAVQVQQTAVQGRSTSGFSSCHISMGRPGAIAHER
jgi:hypothetical protein